MGSTEKEKPIGTRSKKGRSSKPSPRRTLHDPATTSAKSIVDAALRSIHYHLDFPHNPNPNPDDCIEQGLVESLLKKLDALFIEAISKLVAMGYEEDVALKAVLRHGHCHGEMDLLSNILHSSLAYLITACGNLNSEDPEPVFMDLRQLGKYSLADMVWLLQQVRPHLSKGDAMRCLLMTDLHVGRATAIEIPVLHTPCNVSGPAASSGIESMSDSFVEATPEHCKSHGDWGFGNGGFEVPINGLYSYPCDKTLQREIEIPKRFNLAPWMNSKVKRNAAMIVSWLRTNSKQMQMQSHNCQSSSPGENSWLGLVSGPELRVEQSEESSRNAWNQDMAYSVLSNFGDLNLDERAAEDQSEEMCHTLIHQLKDLKNQVKERKEWAHQKAMQAARKLSSDLVELKILRMGREESQRLKKGFPTPKDATIKRLLEVENALKNVSSDVDCANAAVRWLETENAEVRAEIESFKLSASESVTICLEAEKREKKCLKRLLAREKQTHKLQEGIAKEKKECQKQLAQIRLVQKEAELKWRQEVKAKELAQVQVEEEQHLMGASEATSKRKLEALILQIEIDLQCQKDDVQRSQQELSLLKASVQLTESYCPDHTLNTSISGNTEEGCIPGDRECLICMKYEVAVVFLPCAHKVLCANCSDDFGKKGKPTCPCCRVPIEERICVFGAGS